MKRLLMILVLISGVIYQGMAKPINSVSAQLVGLNYIRSLNDLMISGNTFTLELSYTSVSEASNNQPINYFYVFNINTDKGFVIVSATDDVVPILAYSDEGAFMWESRAVNVNKWFNGYETQIKYVLDNHLTASKEISDQWEQLLRGKISTKLNKKGPVQPLMKTNWNQDQYYNDMCPYDKTAQTRVYTGCVATAMAQVMKYWNYPQTGVGFHSYKHDQYGTLSANFALTNYDWKSMTNDVTSSNKAVATLMYHCGVGVDMNYGVNGSGAYMISASSANKYCAEYALKVFFGYKSSLKGVSRSSYSDTQWVRLIKTELDAKRPVIYDGFSNQPGQSGHCFITDGYDNKNYFHLNWGWGGNNNGYYNINSLNPGLLNFDFSQAAIFGIEPKDVNSSDNTLVIFDSIKINNTNVFWGDSFSVVTKIKNMSKDTFRGKFGAAIFDAQGALIEIMDSIDEQKGLPPGYTSKNGLKFIHKARKELLPGNYIICILYKTIEVDWRKIYATSISILDYVDLDVKTKNPLALSGSITLTPADFVVNESASVKYTLRNFGTSTYYGPVRASLYDLNGKFSELIGYQNTSTIYPGYDYKFTISNPQIASPPGSYFLAIETFSDIDNEWEMVNNFYYSNPIRMNVKAYCPPPDIYEKNDTFKNAYDFKVTFLTNTEKINTEGASCHMNGDYDYYSITLSKGSNYVISGKLIDYPSLDNHQTQCSLDAIISYTIDTGKTWSKAFDNNITNSISLKNGGKVYFLVASKKIGEVGTYFLDLTVVKSPILSSLKNITQFSTAGIIGKAIIDTINATVKMIVSSSTDLSSLAPVITVSKFASINPASGIKVDLSMPVQYTVQAQDGSTRIWTVTVEKKSASVTNAKMGASFSIFPNPAKSFITIKAENTPDNLPFTILDALGRKVVTGKLNDNTTVINIESLNYGLYYLKIEDSRNQYIRFIAN